MVGLALGGDALEGLVVDEPAASVRLLLPSAGTAEVVVPAWSGNEFLLPDGSRPVIRTLTPSLVDAPATELDVRVVVHGAGPLSEWAEGVEPGAPAAVSGPGRGYTVDAEAPAFLLAGDETAVPAIAQLLEAIPGTTPVAVHVELAAGGRPLPLLEHRGGSVRWYEAGPDLPPGDALVGAVVGATIDPGARVWVAGEAAAVQRIRRHLFEERGLSRRQATVRGYWKHGRGGDSGDDD
jgi:NADPH-dependent ferric siderophore reductase